jgi:iron complex transport system permease protein
MKITLDLDQLIAENKISRQEYDRLRDLAAQSTSSLAFSILIGFGVIAVSGATLALVPSPYTAILIGAAVLIGGITLLKLELPQWILLAQICTLVGALMLAGGIVAADGGNPRSFIAIVGIYTMGAIFAESALLAVLAVMAVGPILGSETAYGHATYTIVIEQPFISIVVFSIMAAGLFWLSKNVPLPYSRLSIIGSRTSLFMINMGFWIGSLWGDRFTNSTPSFSISDTAFAITWAIALIATGAWAWHDNRRWVLNVVAIFGGIHFYTQWFEHLGATPGTVLIAGVTALLFAIMLRHVNTTMSLEKKSRKL